MFRNASLTDAPRIARMLRRFYAKSGDVFHIPWDHESVLEMIADVMQKGACLVGDNSCAAAFFFTFPFNKSAKVAYVVFWYFERHREMKIFEALAQACLERGCTHFNPSSLWPANTIGKHYAKRGLRPTETQWLGEIACILGQKE